MIDHELTDPAGGALTITHDHQGVWITATEDRDEVTVGPFPVTSLTEAVTVESDAEVSGDLMDGGVTAAAIEHEVVSPERARSLVQENTELRARIGRVEEARDLYRRDVMTEERREQEASDRADESARFAALWKETARRAVRQVHDEDGMTMRAVRAAQRLATESGILRDELVKAEQERDEALRRVRRGECAYCTEPLDYAGPPLTADDITDDMRHRAGRAMHEWSKREYSLTFEQAGDMALRAALTPPPPRPEGAEGLADDLSGWDEMDDYGNRRFTHEELDDLADHLAARGWTKGEK